MHKSSMEEMKKFFDMISTKYVPERALNIFDVGSQAINTAESYRRLITNPNWCYTGYDISPGINVNLYGNSYKWPIDNSVFDVVISGQCLEHVGRPWLWIKEFIRVMKPGGWGCIIAPHTFKYHTQGGDDCWRIWPKGMDNLIHSSNFIIIDTSVTKNNTDTVGIFQKGH